MRARGVAIVCVMWLGCGQPSPQPSPTRAEPEPAVSPASVPQQAPPVSAPAAKAPTAVPAGASSDSGPRAFLPLDAQCPDGYERFTSACVHASYMRRTPLTQLMNEVIDFRHGKPSPVVDVNAPDPRVAAATALERARDEAEAAEEAARRKRDPTHVDPGALTATQTEIEERQRQIEEKARNRGELTPKGTGGNASPTATLTKPQRSAAVSDDGPQTARPEEREKPRAELNEDDLAKVEQGVEKLLGREIDQADCDRAQDSLKDLRQNNCYLDSSQAEQCTSTLIPQAERAVETMCGMTK